ncbi:MAG: fenitrothion hydrolase [Solirubrobacteraceae bacterium]
MRIRRAAGFVLCLGAAALAWPSVASAHAFEIGREDIPIPIWLFIWAAAGVLVASFVALSIGWRTSRLERERWRPLPRAVSRLLTNPATEALCGAAGVGLSGLVVWSGLYGSNVAETNFSVTFVFITFWLGGVLASVLLGDVFRAFNPWRAIARVGAFALKLMLGDRASPPLSYPERLGRWPAAVGLAAFVWMELISGAQAAGVTPRATAVAALIYTAYTLCGMALFGIDRWVSRAEIFSVYFGMFAELSAFEVRNSRLGVRRPLSGTVGWAKVPGSIALVVATIAGTAFDGAQDGLLQQPIATIFLRLQRLGLTLVPATRIALTLFLGLSIAVVAGIYWAGVRGMRTVEGSPRLAQLGTSFAHTLIPIGLAYLVAHYFSYFFFGEQGQFSYLIRDPLGTRTPGQIYLAALSASLIWYVQVGTLVAGHVTGLVLGHDKALAVYGGVKRASLSQRWMLMMMVTFTCLGLYLLSRASG